MKLFLLPEPAFGVGGQQWVVGGVAWVIKWTPPLVTYMKAE